MAKAENTPTDAETRALQAEAALEEVIAERNRLWEELHRRAAQTHELEHYKTVTQQMRTSLSWRITAPLRSAKWLVTQMPELFRRLRRYLGQRPKTS